MLSLRFGLVLATQSFIKKQVHSRTKNLTILRRILAILQPNSRCILGFLLYNSVTFINARIHEKSTHYYRHNFVSIIEEKVHPLLSPKSFVGLKSDFEFISRKTTARKNIIVNVEDKTIFFVLFATFLS